MPDGTSQDIQSGPTHTLSRRADGAHRPFVLSTGAVKSDTISNLELQHKIPGVEKTRRWSWAVYNNKYSIHRWKPNNCWGFTEWCVQKPNERLVFQSRPRSRIDFSRSFFYRNPTIYFRTKFPRPPDAFAYKFGRALTNKPPASGLPTWFLGFKEAHSCIHKHLLIPPTNYSQDLALSICPHPTPHHTHLTQPSTFLFHQPLPNNLALNYWLPQRHHLRMVFRINKQ